MKFGVRKLESWGYQVLKKSWRFDNTGSWQTDRQTCCDRYYPH